MAVDGIKELRSISVSDLPSGELQTKLQTNCAAQDGIRQYKAGRWKLNWRTRAHN